MKTVTISKQLFHHQSHKVRLFDDCLAEDKGRTEDCRDTSPTVFYAEHIQKWSFVAAKGQVISWSNPAVFCVWS